MVLAWWGLLGPEQPDSWPLPTGVLGDMGAFCPAPDPHSSVAMGRLLSPSRDFHSEL